MPEVMRSAVVGGSTLVAPAPVWDPITAAAMASERDAAHAEGFASGLAQGRAEAAAAIDRVSAALSAALDGLHAEVAAQRELATVTDLTLVRAVVDAVLGDAPPASALAVLDHVREAAAMLDDAALEVRLSPADHDVVAGAELDPRLTLVADPTVAAGEATVAGTWGRADLRRDALREAAIAHLTATDEVPA